MRNQSRIPIRPSFRIKVIDRSTQKLIGYVADLSEGGLQLLTDEMVPEGQNMALRLRRRTGSGEMEAYDVDVVCRWSRHNTQTGSYESGLMIECPSVEFTRLITSMRRKRGATAPSS
jgi:hypothetical protein